MHRQSPPGPVTNDEVLGKNEAVARPTYDCLTADLRSSVDGAPEMHDYACKSMMREAGEDQTFAGDAQEILLKEA